MNSAEILAEALPVAEALARYVKYATAMPLAGDVLANLHADGYTVIRTRAVNELTDDIAAMLHYRGRALHPRSHQKTHDGPCEECVESARQAVEFAVASDEATR